MGAILDVIPAVVAAGDFFTYSKLIRTCKALHWLPEDHSNITGLCKTLARWRLPCDGIPQDYPWFRTHNRVLHKDDFSTSITNGLSLELLKNLFLHNYVLMTYYLPCYDKDACMNNIVAYVRSCDIGTLHAVGHKQCCRGDLKKCPYAEHLRKFFEQ